MSVRLSEVYASFDRSSDAFLVLDGEWRLVYLNEQARRYTAPITEPAPGEIFWELYPQLLGTEYERLCREVMNEKVARSFRFFSPLSSRVYEIHLTPVDGGIASLSRDISEYELTRAALAESEERLRLAIAAARLGYWQWDTATDKLDFSERTNEIFGIPQDKELTFTEFLEIIHAEDRERVREAVDASVANRTDYSIEYQIATTSGEIRWVAAIGCAYYSEDGRPRQMAGVVLDITDRKKVTEELARSEERYRSFVQQSSEGIWRVELEQPIPVDLDEDAQIDAMYTYGYLAECNDAMAKMYGFESAEEIFGARLGDLVVRSDPANIAYLRNFIASGYRLVDAESHEHDRYGNSLYFLNNLIGVIKSGQILRAWGTQRDITPQKRFEAELRSSEERFRIMADNAPVLIWLAGVNREFTWFNKPWLDFTGRDLEQELGNGWTAGIHPDDYEKYVETFTSSFNARRPVTTEYRLLHHSGEYRWLLGNGRPLYGPDNEFIGYVGSCIDITDRKRIEEERELILAVERAARNESEHANKMKDEFLSTLSHELRTPLNAILGWSQLLQSEQVSDDMQQGLQSIERNARTQVQIIEDLLDMSRIISGKIRLDVQQLHPSAVIEAAMETLRPAAEAKGIRIQKVLDRLAGPVLGDPSRLQQVIWNLFSNAIKFTPKGGRVQVLLERVNSHIEISISDTGQGIDPEFLPHIFERFRQADSSTKRKHGGLGLGLAIAKNLVELHGGNIRAKSSGIDQGATFIVMLPLMVIQDAASIQEPPAASDPVDLDFPAPTLSGLKVLIVDDEADARELIQKVLQKDGAQVMTAGSAAEALETLKRQKPDILISDIGMPFEDGYDLIRKIRSLRVEEGGNIPALALTAFARSEDRKRAFLAGFQLHVSKPVEPNELVAMVASLAGRINQG